MPRLPSATSKLVISPRTHKTTIESINAKLNEFKGELLSKLNEVKQIATETNNTVKLAQKSNINRINTPAIIQSPRKPLFSTLVKDSSKNPESSNTPPTGKRKRDQLGIIENRTAKTVKQAKLPSPKIGKKSAQIAKPLKPFESKPEQRKFEKAVWVSKLHPETTVEEMNEYIVNNTPFTDICRSSNVSNW